MGKGKCIEREGGRGMRETIISLLILFTLSNKSPLLKVTPVTGISPLNVKVFTVRYPRETDIEWEIVLIDEGFVLRRYTVDLEGENGDRATTLEWTLPAGNFIIASCVYPNELCTTKHIEVK